MTAVPKGLDTIKKSISLVFMALLTCFSVGIFLFDNNVLVYKRIVQDKISVYASCQSLSPLFRNFILSFIGISVILLLLGAFLKSKQTLAYLDSLKRQMVAIVPLGILVFGRFFLGKAIKYIVLIPLFPIFLCIISAAVIHLNLVLHFDIHVFRSCSAYLKNHPRIRRNLWLTLSTVFLISLLIHVLIQDPHFQRFSSHQLFSGDEPKYLRMAYSLAIDKNLDVSDEFVIEEGFENEKKRALETGSRRFGNLSIIGLDGRIYHLHLPGLSVFLLPALLLDLSSIATDPESQKSPVDFQEFPFTLYFTRLWLLAAAIFCFLLLARLIFHLFHSLMLSFLLLLLFITSSPVPGFMFQLYPEFIACFLSLLVLNAIFFPFKIKSLNNLAIVLGIGFLPWLHQRFIIIALALYLTFLINEIFSRKNPKKMLTISLLLLLASLPYFYFFYAITGSPMPNSMHKLYGTSFTRLGMLPLGFFGHLFDYSKGMIWIFPWTFLGLVGIYWGIKSDRKRMISLLIIFAPYYLLTCIHIAWHGMVREPGRYLVVLYPLLLIFFGYTMHSFLKRPTYPKLFLYVSFLVFVLLNKQFWFLVFRFNGSYITSAHIIQMVKCLVIIIMSCFLIAFVNRLDKSMRSLISKEQGILLFKKLLPGTKRAYFKKNIRTSISLLILAFLVIYTSLYVKNWDDEKLSTPLLGSLKKIDASDRLFLIEEKNPEIPVEKSDTAFIDLFKNTYTFLSESPQRKARIGLGSAFFYEKIPRGCYEVNVKMVNSIDENTKVALDFMGEIRELDFKKTTNAIVATTTFLLYADRYIPPEMNLTFKGAKSKPISGQVEIIPISCLTYGKDFILRPRPKEIPKPIRKKGKNRFSLYFIVNTSEEKKKIRFFLYTQKCPIRMDVKKELLLASGEDWVSRKTGLLRMEMGFALPPDFLEKTSGMALFAKDENDHTLKCRSLWLNTHKTYWSFLKKPTSSSKNVIFDF